MRCISEADNMKNFLKRTYNCKPLYIVLLVISSIILIAAILIRITVSDNIPGMMNMPGGQDFSGFSQLPGASGENDIPDFSEEDENGGFSGFGGFSGGMPSFEGGEDGKSFDFSGNMPSFGGGEDSETFNFPGNMPSNMPYSRPESAAGGFGLLRGIRKTWLPVAAVSFLIMSFSIFRIVMISKQNKVRDEQEQAEKLDGLSQEELLMLRVKEEAEQDAQEKERKKKKNITLSVILVLLVAAVLISGSVLSSGTAAASGSSVEEKVVSAAVGNEDIRTVIKGAGTVAGADTSDMMLPDSVKILKWYVKNGDTVSEGDILAEVDTGTVASAVTNLQSLIAELDADLEDTADETVSSGVTAPAAGRVIHIYAASGDDVADVTGEYGALMVLSLDGTFAVDLPQSENVSVGSEVKVTLSNGSVYSGKVAAKTQDDMVVTVSDKYAEDGDTVTVADTNGNELGKGTLYIHSEHKITGFTGTVNKIKVSEGSAVSSGTVLMTLNDTEYSSLHDRLLDKRHTLEDQMRGLIIDYATGYLYAEASGVISGIEDGAAYSASDQSTGASVLSITGTKKTASAGYLGKAETKTTSVTSLSASDGKVVFLTDEIPAQIPGEGDLIPGNPNQNNPEQNNPEQVDPVIPPEGGSDEKDPPFSPGNPSEGTDPEGEIMTEEMLRRTITEIINSLDYQSLLSLFHYLQNPEGTSGNGFPGNMGDFDMGGMGGFSMGGMSGMNGSFSMGGGGYSSASSSSDKDDEIDLSKYELSETAFCSIVPGDKLCVDIQIDENDIPVIHKGTEASVTLDAYPGRSFAGTVSAVGIDGENSGGTTKYTATVDLTAGEKILIGMNASVIITKEEKNSVLSIPLKAVYESGSKVFVYTSYDESTGMLGNPVEIVLGISDGENAEIISGLAQGDSYFYKYADTISYNFLKRLA